MIVTEMDYLLRRTILIVVFARAALRTAPLGAVAIAPMLNP